MQAWFRNILVVLFALLAIAVAGYAFAYLFAGYSAGDPFAASFAVSGTDVPVHFFIAGLALLLAPMQLSRRLREALPWLHRQAGWLYAASVLVGGLAALSLAQHAQGGLGSRLGFSVLAVGWMGATALGIRFAIARDINRHRRWMARSVALTWSAVTLRLMLGVGLATGLPFLPVYVTASWASWLLNLAVCEVLLRRDPVHAAGATRWVSRRSGA